MNKLKPCPFCGSRVAMNTNAGYTPSGVPYSFIRCIRCNITFALYDSHDAKKIRVAWNARTGVRAAMPIGVERHRMNQKGDTYDKYDIESYACPK